MNDERVCCNNMLLHGIGMIGSGLFLFILALSLLIRSVYLPYPEEVYDVLLKYGYVSPSESMINLVLIGVSVVMIIFGFVISWYSGK